MARSWQLLLTLLTSPLLNGCQFAETPAAAATAIEADDTAALQTLADRGGVIRLTKPEYRLTKPIVIDLAKSGFTCFEGGTVARVVMAGPGPAFKFVGTHRGTADPKTIKEPVWARERMPGVEGVEIVGAHAEADGIAASSTMQLTLSRVLIRHCRHGVHLTDRNRNVTIANCHIYQNRGAGVFFDAVNLHQANVIGCHISYNDAGGVVVMGGEVRNLQITGCDIESNQGKEHPPTANVLVDSTGGTNAEVAITGCTIQHNHHAAGSANIRIKGLCTVARKDVDEMRDGNVTITGNVISDVMTNVHLDHARGVVITGNTFWTGYDQNLLVEHSAHVTVGPNNFERNPRYRGEETPATANALVFRDCADCTLTGLHIAGVRAAPAGLMLERCSRMNLSGLTILDCENVGLLLKDVTRSRVSGCLIRNDLAGVKFEAVKVEGGAENMIEK